LGGKNSKENRGRRPECSRSAIVGDRAGMPTP
jgi:hypothetical protein